MPVLTLLAVASLTACGSSDRAASGPITVSGTTTIANVKVGTRVTCKAGPTVKVPRWFGSSALSLPGVPGQIALTHRHNGSVTVYCKP